MDATIIKWGAFVFYVILTFYLAWLGQKKTQSLDGYAVGGGDMKPWMVAFALAATMTSTATFVINPGFVYRYGISAIMGFGLSAGAGLFFGIILLTKGFRKYGTKVNALTVPQWITQRYQDERLGTIFALINMVMIAMIVLIAYGSAVLVDATLGLEAIIGVYHFEVALAFIILFVFAYTMYGGTYAHVYTNTVQGFMMIIVAILLVCSGYEHWGTMFTQLKAQDPNLVEFINPGSHLFRNFFEVFIANFCIGFALTSQPHFLIKALYVKTDREVNQYLALTMLIGSLYLMVVMVGLYARLKFGDTYIGHMDQVTSIYIIQSFGPVTSALISIALLAAGMSTLDGILVALTAIFSNDIYLTFRKKKLSSMDKESKLRLALKISQITLVVLGIISFGICLQQYYSQKLSIAIYAQTWIYAFCNASVYPLVMGMFYENVRKIPIFSAAFVAVVVHLAMSHIPALSLVTNSAHLTYPGDYINPALTAAVGLICGGIVLVLDELRFRIFRSKGSL
ncbi:MAG: sodium:solute symporter family protein [Candidatus Cloacimonetes bacterium]|nr:sodium:solute symporter family protein [Candidatus Cloacimonadota bacterium]